MLLCDTLGRREHSPWLQSLAVAPPPPGLCCAKCLQEPPHRGRGVMRYEAGGPPGFDGKSHPAVAFFPLVTGTLSGRAPPMLHPLSSLEG